MWVASQVCETVVAWYKVHSVTRRDRCKLHCCKSSKKKKRESRKKEPLSFVVFLTCRKKLIIHFFLPYLESPIWAVINQKLLRFLFMDNMGDRQDRTESSEELRRLRNRFRQFITRHSHSFAINFQKNHFFVLVLLLYLFFSENQLTAFILHYLLFEPILI